MPTSDRVVYAGTIAANDAITAANNNKNPGGSNAYNEKTSAPTSLDDSGYTLILQTVNVPIGAGRSLSISATLPKVDKTATDGFVKFQLRYDGNAVISPSADQANGTRMPYSFTANVSDTGAGGLIDVALYGLCETSGTATCDCSADGDPGPITLIVTDAGIAY